MSLRTQEFVWHSKIVQRSISTCILTYVPCQNRGQEGIESMTVFFFCCSHLSLYKIERNRWRVWGFLLPSSAMRSPEELFLYGRRLAKALYGYLALNADFTQGIVAKTFPPIFWMKLHNESDVDNRWGAWDSFPSGKIPIGQTALFPDQKLRMCRHRRKTLSPKDKGWDGL